VNNTKMYVTVCRSFCTSFGIDINRQAYIF